MDKNKLLMQTAELWSQASYAKRNKVGCVIAKDLRIIATGYNGTLPGRNNNCESNGSTLEEVMHAEQNALMFCSKYGLSTKDCDMYVTLSPCMHCAKMIIMAGIASLYYKNAYRDILPLSILEQSGIQVIRYETE
jgi:dCMP deaminase